MTKQALVERFKQYAIRAAYLVLKWPYNIVNKNYADRLNRSASSSAANCRTAFRAKSAAGFIYKLRIMEEELGETLFFFDLLVTINPSLAEEINLPSREGNELLSIVVSSPKTLRNKYSRNRKS